MNSIRCPDCSTEVSNKELTCPSCNFPISKLMGLSSAILTKDAAMVAGLIQFGADVNSIDRNGRTPLMTAASIGNVEIVQILLAAGANPEFVNAAGETALKIARSKDVEKVLRRALVVSRFVSLNKKEIESPATSLLSTTIEEHEPISKNQQEQIELPEIDNHKVEEAPAKIAQPDVPKSINEFDFDATQPITSPEWNTEEIVLGTHIAENEHVEVEINHVTASSEIQESDVDITPPIDAEEFNIEGILLDSEAIEMVENQPIMNAALNIEEPAIRVNESQLDTSSESIIEETALISPFLVQEQIELLETRDQKQDELASIETVEELSESPERQEQYQMAAPATEEPAESIDPDFEEPSLEFITGQHILTELSVWENRKEDYQPDVEMVEKQPATTGEFNIEEPAISVYEPASIETAEELSESPEKQEQYQMAAPATEEPESIDPDFEEPFLEFMTGQQVLTESSVWENRKEEYQPFVRAAANTEEIPPDSYVPEQEPIALETPPIDTAEQTPEAFQASEQELTVPEMKEIHTIPNLHESFLSFQLNENEEFEVPDRGNPERGEAAQMSPNSDFEEPMTFNTSQQLQSKFQEPEDWIELEQPTLNPQLDTEEFTQIFETDQEERQEPQLLRCLECREIIGADELTCSNCQTAIVRRYCAHCSELIPDHSTYCPVCGTYVTEHFHFAKQNPEKFIMGATIGLSILILLMFVTWPKQSSKSVGQGAVRSLPIAQNAPKPVVPNNSEIIFIPPEKKPEEKQEVRTNKTESIAITPKKPTAIKKPIKNNPSKVLVTAKQRSLQSKTAIAKASLTKPSQKPADEENIKKSRSLNSRGFSLIKEGRPGEAIPLLEQSLRSFPKGTNDVHYAYALFNLGVAWRMAGRPDIAIPILEKRIKINNQRDVVARELNTAKQQAREAGFGSFQK